MCGGGASGRQGGLGPPRRPAQVSSRVRGGYSWVAARRRPPLRSSSYDLTSAAPYLSLRRSAQHVPAVRPRRSPHLPR